MPRMLMFLLVLLSATAVPAAARDLVRVDIVDRDHGGWLPQYAHRGDTWVAGVPGHRYAVRLTNTSGERILAVLSVDGVNAVTGETADPDQAGYVLEPWQSAEIVGWRKSLRDVAQFVFTDLPDSYAARTGRPHHVGVIGVAAFRERGRYDMHPMPSPPIARDELRRAPAPAAAGQAEAEAALADGHARQRLGTGHGAREWSPTRHTGFERASRRPAQVLELRYDAPERLAAMGIGPLPPYAHRPWHGRPRAFPGGFVPDPR